MAILTASVGAAGYYNVERIGRNGEFVTGVVTPVLAEDAILHESVLRLHALVLDIEAGLDTADVDARLSEAVRISNRSLSRIGKLLPEGPATVAALDDAKARFGALIASVNAFRHADRADTGVRPPLKDGLTRAEEAYADGLVTIGDIARERMWRNRTEQKSVLSLSRWTAVASALLGLALAGCFALVFSRQVVGPLARMTMAMRRLATGDLTTQVPLTTRRDEVGEMSSALTVFKENAEIRRDLEAKASAHREEMILAGERNRAQETLKAQHDRFDEALNNMTHGLVMFDAGHRLMVCNDAYAEMFALDTALRAPGTPLLRLMEHRMSSGAISAGAGYQDLVGNAPHSQKRVGFLDGRSMSMRSKGLACGGWVTTYEDITEQCRREERIRHLAEHDALSGLPNRTTLRHCLDGSIRGLSHGESVAVLVLDLDRFKNVNDTLGHPVGDELLRQVSARILAASGPSMVARLGGDEFAIVMESASAESATAFADELVRACIDPFLIDGHRIAVGASVGVALASAPTVDPDILMKRADIALYSAKGGGRGRWSLFVDEMESDIRERRALESDLRAALAEGVLDLHYQPIVSFATGRVTSFEALMRWTHPVRGPVSPALFIPIAEDSGLIAPLGRWAMRKACRDAALWPEDVKVAVNLSADQFRHGEDVVAMIREALADGGLPAERLGVEITESLLLDKDERTLGTLHLLRSLGITISLDDFGTGFSSLSYLSQFPFDRIKIDQSFVRGMLDRPDCAAIVKAVVNLASNISIKTVAEGVETMEQYLRLRDEGCDEAQGFLISRPLPLAQVPEMISRDDIKAAA